MGQEIELASLWWSAPCVLGVVCPVLGMGVLFWYLASELRIRRAMRSAPLTRIANAADKSLVRVVGTVETDTPVLAPMSGRPCAFWKLRVESRKNGDSVWTQIMDEQAGVDFVLSDGTGIAWVETARADAVLERDGRERTGLVQEPSPVFERFLKERELKIRGRLGIYESYRYFEGVAEVGEKVVVVGHGTWERDPGASATSGRGYRDVQVPRRLRLSAPRGGARLLLSDHPGVMS